MSMAVSGIQGQLLEVTVVGCNKLRDTEWISRQDPYVCLEYGTTKFRTRTCTDGHKNPSFQEKFTFTLIEGLREISVVVWNSNTLSFDDFIGNGRVQLQKVLTTGYDDSPWSLQTKTGRSAGEVRLIMHYSNANKHGTSHPPSMPAYAPPHSSHLPSYTHPPPASAYPPTSSYPSPYPSYPPSSMAAYPPPSAYPPPPSGPYPPSAYPPPPSGAYPPPPSAYPPSAYPPQQYPPPPNGSSPYPPPPNGSAPHHPPGAYYGAYPPRNY